MTTLEGTLVASYSRGCSILNKSSEILRNDGVEVKINSNKFRRAAPFLVPNLRIGESVISWCKENEKLLQEKVQESDPFIKIQKFEYHLIENLLLVSMQLHTGDAMGSNMGSNAADVVGREILKQENFKSLKFFQVFPEDKKCIPKRPKGKDVTAKVLIHNSILKKKTRCSIEDFHNSFEAVRNGLLYFGTPGPNVHIANGLSAMYLALGQDIAYIAEAANGSVETKLVDKDVMEVSLNIPSLIVASVGGGTQLPAFKEMMKLMKCDTENGAVKIAEIMASMALAGEISCWAAENALEFVSAHNKMGKNFPSSK